MLSLSPSPFAARAQLTPLERSDERCPVCLGRAHGAVLLCAGCGGLTHRACGALDTLRPLGKSAFRCPVCRSGRLPTPAAATVRADGPSSGLPISPHEAPQSGCTPPAVKPPKPGGSVVPPVPTDPAEIAALAARLADDVLRDGFCIVPLVQIGAPGAADLSAMRAAIDRHYRRLLHSHEALCEAAGLHRDLESDGYQNFHERGRGRFEILDHATVTLPMEELVTKEPGRTLLYRVLHGCFHSAGATDPVGDICENAHFRRMSSGCFYAIPGAQAQPWHTDAPSLAPKVPLRPYALNVFIPLVPLGPENGTQFARGTHVAPHQPPELKDYDWCAPRVPVGCALIFDYRVWHRGLGNRTQETRPCLFATFAPPWYHDTHNFSTRRYRRALEVIPGIDDTAGERYARRRAREEAAASDGLGAERGSSAAP